MQYKIIQDTHNKVLGELTEPEILMIIAALKKHGLDYVDLPDRQVAVWDNGFVERY